MVNKDMKEEEILGQILNPTEVKVYLALLKIGSASAIDISKKSGVHRVNVYDILEGLTKKGLVANIIKANKKYFDVASPRRLLELLKEREMEIKKKEDKIRMILPNLLLQYKTAEKRQDIYFFKGKSGLKNIFEDILSSKPQEWLMFGSPGKGPKLLHSWIQIWEKKRIRARINLKGIMNDTEDGRKRGKELNALELTKIKYLPKDCISPADTYVYNNKIAIMLWSEKDMPLALIFENKEIADSFRNYFTWFWKIAHI